MIEQNFDSYFLSVLQSWATYLAPHVLPTTTILALSSYIYLAKLLLHIPRTGSKPASSPHSCDSRPLIVEYLIVLILTVVGMAVRLHKRESHPLWWDEFSSTWISESPLSVIFTTLANPQAPSGDVTPPLYFLLNHFWIGLLGPTESSQRFLTALFGTLAIPLTYLLASQLLNRRIGVLSALLTTLSPLHLYYSQQVRAYSLLLLLTISLMIAYRKLTAAHHPKKWWFIFTLTGILSMYTNFVTLWFVAGLCMDYTISTVSLLVRRHTSGIMIHAVRYLQRIAFVALCGAIALIGPYLLTDAHSPIRAALDPIWFLGLLLLIGATTVVALVLKLLDQSGSTIYPMKSAVFVLAAISTISVSIVPQLWITRVLEVLARQGGTPRPVSVHDMFATLGHHASANVIYPELGTERSFLSLWFYFLLIGLVGILNTNHRAGLLLITWITVPLILAVLWGNENIQLTRHLYPGGIAFTILVAVGLHELVMLLLNTTHHLCLAVLTWVTNKLQRLYRLASSVLGNTISTIVLVTLTIIVVGSRNILDLSYRDESSQLDDYRGVALSLLRDDSFCLAANDINMLKTVSWYVNLFDPASSRQCLGQGHHYYVTGADPRGEGMLADSASSEWVAANITDQFTFDAVRGFALYRFKGDTHTSKAMPISENTIDLDFRKYATWKTVSRADNTGWVRIHGGGFSLPPGGLRPLRKGILARSVFRIVNPSAPIGVAKMRLTADSHISGERSYISVALGRERVGVIQLATFDTRSIGRAYVYPDGKDRGEGLEGVGLPS